MQKPIVLMLITLIVTNRGFAQIEGNVTDSAGKAIPNTTVIAFDAIRNTADTIISDNGGYFAYKNLKRGKYRVVAKASGYQNIVYENVNVNNETPAEGNRISDISGAYWLEIVLKPAKATK